MMVICKLVMLTTKRTTTTEDTRIKTKTTTMTTSKRISLMKTKQHTTSQQDPTTPVYTVVGETIYLGTVGIRRASVTTVKKLDIYKQFVIKRKKL